MKRAVSDEQLRDEYARGERSARRLRPAVTPPGSGLAPGRGTASKSGLTCPECGASMVLRSSRFGRFYGCTRFPQCKASHGAHADGTPLGIPADLVTKQARIVAHAAFDALWQARGWQRSYGYRWLRAQLALTAADCHLARFTRAQCQQVLAVVSVEIGKETL